MATVNTSTIVYSLNTSSLLLNHPANPGMSGGYWIAADIGTLTDKSDDGVIPYRYDAALAITAPQTSLAMDGSFARLTETWDSSTRYYHNSTITHVGPGVNDVTDEAETDAIMFAHLGTIQSTPQPDNPFYWDRIYQTQEGGDYFYYQYHQHNPNVYEDDYENGRIVFSDGKYIAPEDKHYGYLIYSESGNNPEYQIVLARIHQPSVGGAHSSHLDVQLPSNTTTNTIIGGIHVGSSNRYHAFYLQSDGSNWKVLSRTFVLSSRAFTTEVNLGTFDLADPVFTAETTIEEYPVRASCGALVSDKLFFPVIYNGAGGTYDLKIWRLDSADTLSSASLDAVTIVSGSTVKPDCHLLEADGTLYAVVGEVGSVELYSYDNGSWISEGTIVTNGSNPIRVHGTSYQASTRKFFVQLSGDEDVTGTYSGQGVYSFQVQFTAVTYPHFDFSVANNAFVLRAANTAGYVKYTPSTYTWRRINAKEPDPIPVGNNIFKYDYASPKFFKRNTSAGLGGGQYYYDGLALKDGRMVFCGLIEDNDGNRGGDDFLLAIYPNDEASTPGSYWAHGGSGPDYFNGIVNKSNSNFLYLTGYSKSQLVDLNELRIHPYARRLSIDNANTEFRDLARTSSNTIVTVGTKGDTTNVAVTKYDANLAVEWCKLLTGANVQIGYGIAVDGNDDIYVVGNTTTNTASAGGFISKLYSNGELAWVKTVDSASSEEIRSVRIVNNNVYLALANTTNNTQVVKMSTDGTTIHWQKNIPEFSVRKITIDTSENSYLAGDDGTNTTVFKLNNNGSLTWARQLGAGSFYDVNVDSGSNVIVVGANSTPNAIIAKFDSSGTLDWSYYMNVDSQMTGVTIDGDNNIYAVGYENQIERRDWHPEMHMMTVTRDRGFIVKYTNSGTLSWKNYLWRKDPEENTYDTQFHSCIMDHLDDNMYVVGIDSVQGSEESGFLGRFCRNGYGQGVMHKDDDVTDYFRHEQYPQDGVGVSSLVYSVGASGVTPTLTNSSLSIGSPSHTLAAATINFEEIFDGSSGLWNFFIAKFDLDIAQLHLNSMEHMAHIERDKFPMYNTGAFVKFWEIGTVGDSIADDGNVFGYDIFQYSDNVFFCAGQTSGSLTQLNTGDSGAYDGILVRFDESAVPGREINIYQVGEEFDEEMYACCKMADGNVAMVGRTAGTIGGTNQGGYDIILSILDVTTNTYSNYSTGGDGDDKGVNVHDIGGNQLVITYQTSDNINGFTTTTSGGDDIGVLIFNYGTQSWANAFQTGSDASDILETNGRVSAVLPGNVIAVVGSTTGTIASDGTTSQGGSDIFVSLFDLNTGNVLSYQVGSTGGDIGTCCFLDGDKLLIGGYTDASFTEPEDSLFVHFDVYKGLKGVTTID